MIPEMEDAHEYHHATLTTQDVLSTRGQTPIQVVKPFQDSHSLNYFCIQSISLLVVLFERKTNIEWFLTGMVK